MPVKATSSVSVIMPTYNGELFLMDTLESLKQQTYPISELIISDDSSSDGTLEIARSFANSVNFKVHVVEHTPGGVTANYLNALYYTCGDIICVADQDDVWLANKAELVVQSFEQENISLVCHDCLLVDAKLTSLGRTLRGDASRSKRLSESINSYSDSKNLLRFLKGGLPLLAHSLAFKKELKDLLLKKPTNIDLWWFEEWLSCIALTQGRLHFIADQLVLYRQHDWQTSGGFVRPNQSSDSSSQTFTDTKYASRIKKMRFCASVSKGQALAQRQRAFTRYGLFLERRDVILDSPLAGKWLFKTLTMLFNGDYRLYANGLMSFALDLITKIRSLKKT